MVGFFRTGNALVCDDVSLEDTARAHGTPLYVYSAASIRNAYRELDQAFASHPHRIHYAMKANSSLAVVRLLREALRELSPPLRTAVLLRDIHELSYQEIAAQLGVAEGTVKSRINRGRAELARQIEALRAKEGAPK